MYIVLNTSQSEKIDDQFDSFMSDFIQAVQKADFSEIKAAYINGGSISSVVPCHIEEKMQQAKNFESFVNVLKPAYCNWLNFSSLETAAHKADAIFGTKEASNFVTQYTESLYPKSIIEVVQKIPQIINMDHYSIIIEIWDKNLVDITFENVINHQEQLAMLFKIEKYALILQQIGDDTEIHWAVSTKLVAKIKTIANHTSTRTDIKKCGVLDLVIDSERIVINDHAMVNEDVSGKYTYVEYFSN